MPLRRDPKYKTRRPSVADEQQVLDLRKLGNNKFEIASRLKQKSDKFTPSASGVYNILKHMVRTAYL